MKLLIMCLALMVICISAQAADWMWARGSLHTHTTNSDGDGSPQAVADWYKDHGYQFLVISDHGIVTDPLPLDKAGDNFVLVHGEEIAVEDQGEKPIHGVAINLKQTVPYPKGSATQGKTLQSLVTYIRGYNAVPMVCHPSWCWAFTHREMLSIREPYLLEIANMGSGCNNEGSLSTPSVEQMWDVLLSNGRTVYATATDDMHTLNKPADGPAKGWVVCRVSELTPQTVVTALSKGDFYASTGVELLNYSFDGKRFNVRVKPKEVQRHIIRFVGKWGEMLQETNGTSASYMAAGKPVENSYIRCKVIAGDGTVAWTQAFKR